MKELRIFTPLQEIEQKLELTQKAAAEKLDMQGSRYRQIRYGYCRPRFIDVLRIAKVLSVEVKDVVKEASDMFDKECLPFKQ